MLNQWEDFLASDNAGSGHEYLNFNFNESQKYIANNDKNWCKQQDPDCKKNNEMAINLLII